MSTAAFSPALFPGVSNELLDALGDELAAVERELAARMGSAVATVEEIGRHTLEAGGKRLRPAFIALAARACGGGDTARIARLGACMEMIHMATLIHDDVVDHAATRRGRETAGLLYGGTASILSGDVLLARAMAILADDGDLKIMRAVADAVVEMAEGEVLEVETRGRFDLGEAEHLRVLRMKTAAFIEACCLVGALAAGATPSEQEALRQYGAAAGMAFQIVDDLLDYRGDFEQTGKPRASDFREGCATLPLIYLLEELSDEEREVAGHKFGDGVADDEVLMICGWMASRGAFERSEATARRCVDEARAALDGLPSSPARDLLGAVAGFVLEREA
ncbi:MAG: polyprenyl synthetase family protein [Fimbriimonas ginsengisoli]|uniref:Polyprenyl synthetase family protein n=1 Tax=Fimbriimonas ginsengisoli TaxID=1005039 RepID=A0A931PW35_FIMGI|nr:polyprenyl synthetase family protein [Fimbriimonas ginsengisoli]